MAYLDFGFGTGLAYKYDFNERYRRKRQSNLDRIEQKRYDDKIAYQEERNQRSDDIQEEQLIHDRDNEASQDAINQSQLYYKDIPETASRWNKKRQDYTQPLLKLIGEIENTPDYNSDPKKLAELQDYYRQVQTMEGESELKSASEDYAKMVEAYKNDDIDSKEYAEEIKKWEDYNEGVDEYTEDSKNHYAYIPKDKFSMPKAVADYVQKGMNQSEKLVTDSDGNEYLVRELNSQQLDTATEELYNQDEKAIEEAFASFGDPEKGWYDNDAKKWLRKGIKDGTTDRKVSKTGSFDETIPRDSDKTTDHTDHYNNMFNGKATNGTTPNLKYVVPVGKDGSIESSNLFFLSPDESGQFKGWTDNSVYNINENEITINGGVDNIDTWVRTIDGSKFAKAQVEMDRKEFLIMRGNMSIENQRQLDSFIIRSANSGTYREEIDKEGEDIIVENKRIIFTAFIPFKKSGNGKIEYNNRQSKRDVFGTKDIDIGTNQEKETKKETEGAIDTSKYNTE